MEFFISKRLHIGALAYVTAIYFMRFIPETANSSHPLIPLIAFFIVWSAYLENLTTDKKEDKLNPCPHGVSPDIEAALYPIEKFYPLFYLAALVLSLLVNLKCFWLSLFTILIWLSYVHRWLPKGKNGLKRLKEFYIIKNLVPPLGWIFSVGIIPFVASGAKFVPEYSLLIFIAIFSSFREEIKFDIPDTRGDMANGIKTLPNTIGEPATKKILGAINYISILMLFLMLFLLYQNQQALRFKYLLMNSVPLLTLSAHDQSFVDKLFEKGRKEYCNIGVVWWLFLLSIYLILSYPYNIFVFILLRLAGNFSADRLVDGYLAKTFSGSYTCSKDQDTP